MRDRRGGLLTVAVIVGAIWAVVQAFMTDAIVGQKEIGLTCTERLPKDDLTMAAWGAVIAVLIAFAAARFGGGGSRRSRCSSKWRPWLPGS